MAEGRQHLRPQDQRLLWRTEGPKDRQGMSRRSGSCSRAHPGSFCEKSKSKAVQMSNPRFLGFPSMDLDLVTAGTSLPSQPL